MRPLFAMLLGLMTFAAMAQPVFVERLVYQHPPPDTKAPTREVAELLVRLSDESSDERQMAGAALLKMGATIEPQLRWARKTGENGGDPLSWPTLHLRDGNKWVQDPRHLQPWHAENELDVLISRLEEQRLSAPSIITLQYKNEPLTNVLRDLGRQAETDVIVGGWYSLPKIDTARITINIERVNFWDALRAIRNRSGLTPTHVNAQNRLVLTVATSNQALQATGAIVSGVLRIAPLFAKQKFTLTAFVEPKLSHTGRHALVKIEQCEDDRGVSLIAEAEFQSIEEHNTAAWTVPLDFKPLEPRRSIKMLRGSFSVGIGATDRYLTIPNVLKSEGKSRDLDRVKVTVKNVRAGGSHIDVELSAPKNSPYPRTFSTSSTPEVWLWDEARATIASESRFNGIRREADRDVGSWTLITRPGSPPPSTLAWKTPPETRWHTVPFELRDIAVPSW